MPEFLRHWKFDIPSMIVTVLLAPLAIFLLRIVLRYLKHWTSYVLEGLLYWGTRVVKHSFAGALTLRRYCRLQLSSGNQYLHVPSLRDMQLHIDRVYVTLTLEGQATEKGSYSHNDLLDAGSRVRVMGDPGSGKSSLVKRVFRDACKNAIESPRKARLPILLELKNLQIPGDVPDEALGEWFYKNLRAETEKSDVYQMGECFDSYARTEGLLVLLDGLDEVSTTDYPRVEAAILRLSDKLNQIGDKNAVVLTMRTQFHHQVKDAFRHHYEVALFLNPFTPSDVYRFLSRWPFKENAARQVTRIYKELTDRPTLREMCSNPLVLSMYVADDQESSQSVAPDSRTEFYSKVTEELVIRRRQKQTGSAIGAASLREQRFRVLGKLAYQHLLDPEQPSNSLRWSTAVDLVRRELKCTEAEAEAKFQEMAKETGLVSEERPRQSFRFIHLTFCEFLAAYEAVEGLTDGWETLIRTHADFRGDALPQLRTRLSEVIPFACGLLPRVSKPGAMDDVDGVGDSRLSALSFLETKLYEHPSWTRFVGSESEALVGTPAPDWDEQWLRRLHLFNVVVGDAKRNSAHLPAAEGTLDLAEFFRTLVEKQSGSLEPLLSAYAAQDAAAAFRLAEVCGIDLAADFPGIVISKCDQLPFFSLIKEQALREKERIELWAFLLSEAALRSPVVARWLQETPPDSSLAPYVERAPKSKSWHKHFPAKPSLYSQLLTIAVNIERVKLTGMRSTFTRYKGAIVALLADLKPFSIALEVSITAISVILISGCVITLINVRPNPVEFFVGWITSLVLYVLVIQSFVRIHSKQVTYQSVLNILLSRRKRAFFTTKLNYFFPPGYKSGLRGEQAELAREIILSRGEESPTKLISYLFPSSD